MISPSPTGAEGPRRQARERALGLLYEAECKHEDPVDVLDALLLPADPYADAVVRGVSTDRQRIDELLSETAVGWELDRMAVVDRTLLRMAVYELLHRPDVPVAVVLDESVELAKTYSTEQSGGFVNGILSTIARRVRG